MTLPVKNQAYIFYMALVDKLDPDTFKANPTIATGDFKVSTDGVAFANLTTLPVVDPSGSITVKITLSAAEMTGDKVNIQGIDVSGAEWQDTLAIIDVPEGSVETLLDLDLGDHTESNTSLIIKKAGSETVILNKKITGSLLADNITVRTTEP